MDILKAVVAVGGGMGVTLKNGILYFGLFLIMITLLTGCSTRSAGHYYKEGQKCFQSDNYEEAAINYQKAIALNSKRADYYIEYGLTLIALEQYEESLAQFDSAYLERDIQMINENNKRVYRGKGIAYYHMLQYEKAIEQFDLALLMDELTELDMDILYYKGSTQEKIGSYKEAVETYTSILSHNKEDAAIYDARALAYSKLGDYEKSLTDYDMAISLQPNCFEYYFGKYFLMTQNKKEDIAEETLKLAGEIELITKEDQFNLAKVHYFQGNFDGALQEFKLGIENGFSEAYFYLGKISESSKDYATAIYNYEKFIKEGKIDTPSVYNEIGSCLIKTGEYKMALSYLEKGIAYQDVSVIKSLLHNEIVAYEDSGMFTEALEKLMVYNKEYPEDADGIREEEFLRTRIN